MGTVKYANQSGTIYVYETSKEWNPELGKYQLKRTCIGREDPKTGKVIPTSHKKGRPRKNTSDGEDERYTELYESFSHRIEVLEERIKNLTGMNESLSAENAQMRKELERFWNATRQFIVTDDSI